MQNEIITSTQNQQIKEIVKLRDKKQRYKTGLFIIEGEKELNLALKFAEVVEIFCIDKIDQISKSADQLIQNFFKKGIKITEVNKMVFEKIAYANNPFPVLAVAKKKEHQLKHLKLSKNPLLLIAESTEKPGNIGAMLRTADAVGADGFILTEPITDLYNPNVLRASRGVLLSFPIAVTDNKELADWLKEHKINIFAASPEANDIYLDRDFAKPTAFIFGAEKAGISNFWRSEAKLVKIPMQGISDSLNTSATAAILLYEASRQRNM